MRFNIGDKVIIEPKYRKKPMQFRIVKYCGEVDNTKYVIHDGHEIDPNQVFIVDYDDNEYVWIRTVWNTEAGDYFVLETEHEKLMLASKAVIAIYL